MGSNTTALTEDQHRELGVWRAIALEKMPYMAPTLYALRPVNSPGLKTFAVDEGLRLYIDFGFVGEWSMNLKAEALLHECSHVLQAHNLAAKDSQVQPHERRTWNVAADCAINDDLRDAGCVELVAMGVLPENIDAPDYLTATEYMNRMREQQRKNPQQPAPGGDPSPSDGGEGGDDGEPYDGCGSIAGGEPAPGELGDGDLNGEASPASGAEADRTRIQTAQSIRDAASKSRGSVPGGLVDLADQVLAPAKTPWRQVIGRTMRGCLRAVAGSQDTSYVRRSSRRHNERILTANGQGRRIVHPGTIDYKPIIAVVRDTSGSMGDDELQLTTNEIVGIADALGVRGEELIVLDVDADVHAKRRYTGAKSLAEVSGRGGTDMGAGILAAVAMKPTPSVVVIITDGYTPWPAVQPSRKIKFIACIVGTGNKSQAHDVPSWIRAVTVDD